MMCSLRGGFCLVNTRTKYFADELFRPLTPIGSGHGPTSVAAPILLQTRPTMSFLAPRPIISSYPLFALTKMKMETASAASGAVRSVVTNSVGEYASSTNSAAPGAKSGSKSIFGSYGSGFGSGSSSGSNSSTSSDSKIRTQALAPQTQTLALSLTLVPARVATVSLISVSFKGAAGKVAVSGLSFLVLVALASVLCNMNALST